MRQCDGEHALIFERFLEHGPVTGLENVERQKRLWKQDRIRKGHDADFFGEFHGFIIA